MQQTLKFTFWFIIVTFLSKGYYRKNRGVIGKNIFGTSLPQIEIGDAPPPQIEIGDAPSTKLTYIRQTSPKLKYVTQSTHPKSKL